MTLPLSIRRQIWNRLVAKLETLTVGAGQRLTVHKGLIEYNLVTRFPAVIVFPPLERQAFDSAGSVKSLKRSVMTVEIQGFVVPAGGVCDPAAGKDAALDELQSLLQAAIEGKIPFSLTGSPTPQEDMDYENRSITAIVTEVGEFVSDSTDQNAKAAFYMEVEFTYRHFVAAPWAQCD